MRRCRDCGRPLREDISRAAAHGPECAARRWREIAVDRRITDGIRSAHRLRALHAP